MRKILKKSSLAVVLVCMLVLALPACNKKNETKEPLATQSQKPTQTTQSQNPTTTPDAAMKNITVEVVNEKGESKTYNIKTDAKLLYDAIKTTDGLSLEGNVGDYGYYITAVNGVTADFDKDQAYWAFYVNGEYGQTSIDTQPIADGDDFRLVYEISKSE